MRPSIALCLLSICMQLKLHVCDRICLENQYTITWSNGSVKSCLYCQKCHPGYGLSPVCGTSIMYPPENIDCNPCPSGKFSDKEDSAPCQNCQECVPHELVASNCTRSSDRNCTGTCTKGYYFAKKAPHNCQQCSHCCNDGKDEIQPECVNQGLNATDQHCSLRPDKECGPEPTTTQPTTTQPTNHGIVALIVAPIVGLLVILLVSFCVCYKKNVRTARVGNQVHPLQETQPSLQASRNPGFSSNSNPATPQASPGAEGGQRIRTRSGSPGNYQPLAEEDPNDAEEPLEIVQHPTHQTHKEGSRAVFECKAQGKKNLTYQWLKDGTKIQGQHSCTLVLDSVKVRDFGWYSCEVWYAYGQLNRSECVESSPGELNVIPRDGMRFKYLDEAFQQSLDTQLTVENLLVKEPPGCGGWRQVAFKWKMDIDNLERSHEGGKGVISYLKATYPNLTVYEFCKTLKEANIKRFDIIKVLLVHLVSVPQEQTA